MEVLKVKDTFIELAGAAREFSALARKIKKSKLADQISIHLEGGCKSIELICAKIITRISMNASVQIEFTEETKNKLHAIISVPSDAPLGSRFVINPNDCESIFSVGSMGIVLIVNDNSN